MEIVPSADLRLIDLALPSHLKVFYVADCCLYRIYFYRLTVDWYKQTIWSSGLRQRMQQKYYTLLLLNSNER